VSTRDGANKKYGIRLCGVTNVSWAADGENEECGEKMEGRNRRREVEDGSHAPHSLSMTYSQLLFYDLFYFWTIMAVPV
jgi:hypothetical protein